MHALVAQRFPPLFHLLMEDGEEETLYESSAAPSSRLEALAAALDDIVLGSPDFKTRIEAWYRGSADAFEDAPEGEHPLSHTALFETYTSMVEAILDEGLRQRLPDYGGLEELETLIDATESLPDLLVGDVFDVLQTLVSFEEWCDTMASWKQQVAFESGEGGGGSGGGDGGSGGAGGLVLDIRPVR